jgi:hypothetical protein
MDLNRSHHYYGRNRSFVIFTSVNLVAQNWLKLAEMHQNWDLEDQDLDLHDSRLCGLIGDNHHYLLLSGVPFIIIYLLSL